MVVGGMVSGEAGESPFTSHQGLVVMVVGSVVASKKKPTNESTGLVGSGSGWYGG